MESNCLASVNKTPSENVRPCGMYKLVIAMKLRKPFGIYGISNKCLRHLGVRPLEN
jgi:hypothetical protein